MKYLRITIFFVMVILTPPYIYNSPAQATNSPLHVDLTQSLGFIIGQRLSLGHIKNIYPSLNSRVEMVNHKFNVSFSYAEENIIRTLKAIYGDKSKEVISLIEKHAEFTVSGLNSSDISQEMAATYLNEVEARAQGNIPSPILETLLTYQFEDRPADEFIREFRTTYRTADHPKAKGLDFQIQIPKSWHSKEGRRPNIIQFFASNNGRGPGYTSIMTRNIVEEALGELTQEEIEFFGTREGSEFLASEFFDNNNLREMARSMGLNNVRNVKTGTIILDRWPGAVIAFLGDGRNLDMVMTMYNQTYIVIYKNYMILLHFQVAKLPNDTDNEMMQRISKFSLLFRLMANSLVIESQY